LNKTDLIESKDELEAIEKRIRQLNPQAPIFQCQHSEISPKEVINIGAFDLDRVLNFDPYFLGDIKNPKHDQAVSSTSTKIEGEVNIQLLDNWIHRLLHDQGEQLYRYKGIIAVKGRDEKYVFQGVGHYFSGKFSGKWGEDEARESTFVFIGKDLNLKLLNEGFKACRQTDELRFTVGTLVEANVGRYEKGVVIEQWDEGNAYRIRLKGGREIWAPVDIDVYVRLPVDGKQDQ